MKFICCWLACVRHLRTCSTSSSRLLFGFYSEFIRTVEHVYRYMIGTHTLRVLMSFLHLYTSWRGEYYAMWSVVNCMRQYLTPWKVHIISAQMNIIRVPTNKRNHRNQDVSCGWRWQWRAAQMLLYQEWWWCSRLWFSAFYPHFSLVSSSSLCLSRENRFRIDCCVSLEMI